MQESGTVAALEQAPSTAPPITTAPRLNRLRRNRMAALPVWAMGCSLIVLATILATDPRAEVGISDDWSYVHIAQILARTGHIVYTGWATPILGWQLYLAALFIKLFGFSFTTVRASVILISVGTAFLCQRTFVRAGINDWNASIGTLTLLLSPLVLLLEVSFLSDIAGFFAIVLCLYLCLRAIQAETSYAAIAWIGLAALSNAVFGSSRQIAWLGALVMVPSALWILRRNRRVLIAGVGFWMFSLAIVFFINHWFQQQPYTQIEPLIPGPVTPHVIKHLTVEMLRATVETIFLLLPVLLMFLPALRRKSYPWPVYLGCILCALQGLHLWRDHNLDAWAAPYLMGVAPFSGLPDARIVLTIAVILSTLTLLTVVATRKEWLQRCPISTPRLSNQTFALLLLPFTAAYVALLAPRAGFETIWDRYLIPLLFVVLLFALRFYQQRFQFHLPYGALLLSICFGCYAAALTHDVFAMERARVDAINEILARGVPSTSIGGGWEYDGWTELQHSSHIVAPRMRIPAGDVPIKPTHFGLAHCTYWTCDMFPHVLPLYAISFRPGIGSNNFAPVHYHTWIGPAQTVYVTRFPDPTDASVQP